MLWWLTLGDWSIERPATTFKREGEAMQYLDCSFNSYLWFRCAFARQHDLRTKPVASLSSCAPAIHFLPYSVTFFWPQERLKDAKVSIMLKNNIYLKALSPNIPFNRDHGSWIRCAKDSIRDKKGWTNRHCFCSALSPLDMTVNMRCVL